MNKFDKSIELKDNALLRSKPHLFNEWDFEKNAELGLDIYEVSKGSHSLAWWICPKCGSSYSMIINNRNNGSSCSYCSGKKVNHTNSLASLNPELGSQWHPTLNGELTPHDVTVGSKKKVWWKCSKHDKHVWESQIKIRNYGNGCPFCCQNPKVLKGYNDMWTTNPELASLLVDPEDGYKYTQNSNKKLNWKCIKCNQTIKNISVYIINKNRKHRLVCSTCKKK